MTSDDMTRLPGRDDVLGSESGERRPLLDRVPSPWRMLAGAVVVVAALVQLGPDLVSSGDAHAPPGSPTASGSIAPSRFAPRAPLVGAPLPVRGDLAADEEFLSAVMNRVKAAHPDADRVLFAATQPGGGRVAMVGRDREEPGHIQALDVYALRVPAGGSVATGTVSVIGRGLIESTSRRVRP
jgi:hypothetical protein